MAIVFDDENFEAIGEGFGLVIGERDRGGGIWEGFLGAIDFGEGERGGEEAEEEERSGAKRRRKWRDHWG